MLEAKDAVKASLTTFPQLFHEETFRDLRLEEIALARDNHIWDITVSYRNPDREEEIRVKRVEGSNALNLLVTKFLRSIPVTTNRSVLVLKMDR